MQAAHRAPADDTQLVEFMSKSIELPALALLPLRSTEPFHGETLAQALGSRLREPDLNAALERELGLEEHLLSVARELARRAYPPDRTTNRQSDTWIDHAARVEMHRALLTLYQQHVRLPTDSQLVN